MKRKRGRNEFAASLLMVENEQEMCMVIVSFHIFGCGKRNR
jgi:hypothetical protein